MSSKVIDPTCGMQVYPANSAGSFEYKRATYHFCNIHCRDKFKVDPQQFLRRADASSTSQRVCANRT
jgi:YHS domain-containing protein